MAPHINGPLYYERMGRTGRVMLFIHPNPMDQSCWIFQLAHFSTWYRCIAIDIPGYGRSPAAGDGLTMTDIAQACWESIDEAYPNESAILVGCSVGSSIIPYMYHLHPDRTAAIILSGTGYNPAKEFTRKRIEKYQACGIDYRREYALEDLSPAFRATQMAHFFVEIFMERNGFADRDTIIRQFQALAEPYPEGHHENIACPAMILSGTEDFIHQSSYALRDRIPNCALKTMPGAGHACHMEQPWMFNRFMIEFLASHHLFPGIHSPGKEQEIIDRREKRI